MNLAKKEVVTAGKPSRKKKLELELLCRNIKEDMFLWPSRKVDFHRPEGRSWAITATTFASIAAVGADGCANFTQKDNYTSCDATTTRLHN